MSKFKLHTERGPVTVFRKFTVVSAMAVALVIGAGVPAQAQQDVWYDVPNYGYSDADAIVTDWFSGNIFQGYVSPNPPKSC